MSIEHGKAKDPVCGMQVDAEQYATEYLGMRFAFCSQQCRERFLANPHAYIGVPGEQAPKQAGMELVKRRRLRLAEPLSATAERAVTARLRAMMGVRAVEVRGRELRITYDLLQATAVQIEAALGEAGAPLRSRWTDRLQRAVVHYLEETEVENMEVRPGHGGHGHGGAHRH